MVKLYNEILNPTNYDVNKNWTLHECVNVMKLMTRRFFICLVTHFTNSNVRSLLMLVTCTIPMHGDLNRRPRPRRRMTELNSTHFIRQPKRYQKKSRECKWWLVTRFRVQVVESSQCPHVLPRIRKNLVQ